MTDEQVRQIRFDHQRRERIAAELARLEAEYEAERARLRAMRAAIPSPTDHAARLGIHHTRAVMAARGLAYKHVKP